MKERPIIFCGEMVKAILEGRKTQTRRVVKPQPIPEPARASWFRGNEWFWESNSGKVGIFHPQQAKCFAQPSDRLWVKETHYFFDGPSGFARFWTGRVWYRADGLKTFKWRPSIFMPRWASRITLEIEAVRVERLQDITEEDAKAEGCYPVTHADGSVDCGTRKTVYRQLWDTINGKTYPWATNPWVWVLTFHRVKP